MVTITPSTATTSTTAYDPIVSVGEAIRSSDEISADDAEDIIEFINETYDTAMDCYEALQDIHGQVPQAVIDNIGPLLEILSKLSGG